MKTIVTVGSSAFGTACRRRTTVVPQALGARRRQIVAAHLVEQRGAHHQQRLRVPDGDQGDHRQHHVVRHVQHVREARRVARLHAAGREQPGDRPDAHREHDDQQQPQPERRAPTRASARHPVLTRSREPAVPPGGARAEPQPERRVEHHGRAGQQQRRGQLLPDQLADGRVELVRGPEVARERLAAVAGELLPQRQVETELPAQRRAAARRVIGAPCVIALTGSPGTAAGTGRSW